MAIGIVVGDILEVGFVCRQDDQAGVNVRKYRCASVAGTGTTIEQAAIDFGTIMGPLYAALIANTASYYLTRVRRISPNATVTVESAVGAAVGTAGVTPLPLQVAGVITLVTTSPGPSGRGRSYVPFPATGDSGAAGHPTAGYVTRLSALGVALSTQATVGIGGDTATLVPILIQAAAPGYKLISGYNARDKWGTQRRRGDYGSKNF